MLFSSGQNQKKSTELPSHKEISTMGLSNINIHGGIQHWLQQRFARWQERLTLHKKTSSTELTANFRLIDVLADLSQRVLENPDLLIAGTTEKKQLEALLTEQISAFVAEQLSLPYHSYANVVDWSHYITTGLIDTYHPKYKDTATRGDLLVMARRASSINVGPEGARYRREHQQLEVLYHEKLQYELEHWQEKGVWTETTVGNLLSDKVREQYGLTESEEIIFVGNKYALVMPENSDVYPEGKAYTNLHQMVFLPQRQQALLLIEQWFDAHTYRDQAFILNSWEKNAVPKGVPLSEDILMSAVVTLPGEVKNSPAFEVFATMACQLSRNKKDTDFRLNQQATLGLLHANKDSITGAATFLTQVLIAEYLVCLEHPEALSDLPARLWGAYEMMAHPFLTGEAFPYAAARDAYMQSYLQPWIGTATQTTSPTLLNGARRQTTHQAISRWMENRSALHAPLTDQQAKQRNTALTTYANLGYTQIFQRVASQAWCLTGSVGGLTKIAQSVQSPLGQAVLQGHLVNPGELAQLIGQERAQKWQTGVCLNPGCPNGQQKQLIGECEFCIHCELLSQSGKLLERDESRAHNQDFDSSLQTLQNFTDRSFTNPDQIADYYRQHFRRISVDILPAYFISGEKIIR